MPSKRKLTAFCGYAVSLLIFLQFESTAQICSINAGVDQTICVTQQPLALTGTVGSSMATPALYNWIKLSGPAATIGNQGSLLTTVSGLTPGNYVFQLSGKCIDGLFARDIVAVTVLPDAPTAIVGADTSFCHNTAIQLSVNTVSTGFTGTCSANYDDVQVIIDAPVPAISAGTNQSFCQGSVPSFAIGTTANPGISYSWSPQTMLSNPSVSQPIFQGTNNAGNYVYTLRANSGSCETFAVINIQVKPTPFANIEITDGSCGAGFRASDPGNGIINPV